MISFSRLLCDAIGPMDSIRYNEAGSHRQRKVTPRPVVVWNCTRQCNLVCRHCYASADNRKRPGEMDTATAKQFITSVAEFGSPVLMFSGGEPLLRHDFFELAQFAKDKGLRLVISTNGTKIDEAAARKIADIGFAEVGISLDGVGRKNDEFRGKKGAFDAALNGMRNCLGHNVRVSLRIVMTHFNHAELPAIFELVEREGIKRVCLYHLAYAGRGGQMQAEDMSTAETRNAIDLICRETIDMYKKGSPKEILTVGNHTDGVYAYLKVKEKDSERAEKILKLLETNGGNNSGEMIGAVDDLGNVHPDQFWWHYSVGNVKEKKFGDIWSNDSEPLLHGLRNRRSLLKGRCSRCNHINMCNGNLRVRAEARGDLWGDDPACYLTDEEIGLN